MLFSPMFTNALAVAGWLGISTVVVTGTAYALFRYLGDKWLTAKFNERLESYRHAQQRELERLKFEINALMDRTAKLNQQEFEVLPEIWAKLNDAYGEVVGFTSPMQSYPDIDRMSLPQANDFIDNCELADWQKEELRTGDEKGQRYFKMRFWHDRNRVWKTFGEFNNFLIKKGIFIQPKLKEDIAHLRDILDAAFFEREFEEKHPNPRPNRFEKGEVLRREGGAKLDAIGEAVQNRLWAGRSIDDARVTLPAME